MLRRLFVLLCMMFALSFSLIGCMEDGENGAVGPQGEAGTDGTNTAYGFTKQDILNYEAVETCTTCHASEYLGMADVHTIDANAADLAIDTVSYDGTNVIVTFSGEAGLTESSFSFAIARLEPAASAAYLPEWKNYNVNAKTRSTTFPTGWTAWPDGSVASANQASTLAVTTGTYAEVDGAYTFTFSNTLDIASNLTKTHRVVVYYRNTTTGKQASIFKDFVPDGSAVVTTRNLVETDSCNSCHGDLALHGSRRTVEFCVTCHNDDSFDPETGRTVDMTQMIHKIHKGHSLAEVENGGEYAIVGYGNRVHDYSEVGYPNDLKDCNVCHIENAITSTLNAEACTSCHDGLFIDDTATEVPAGMYAHTQNEDGTPNTSCANDTCHDVAAPKIAISGTCASCHNEGGTGSHKSQQIAEVHSDPVREFEATVATTITGVTRDGDNLSVTWTATVDGTPVALNGDNSSEEMVFTSMSFQVGYLEGDDVTNNGVGVAGGQPLSYSVGTYTTFSADNLTATTTFPIPAAVVANENIERVLVALQGHPRGPVDGVSTSLSITSATYTAELTDGTASSRRQIVSVAKCLECHGKLSFHGGNRVDSIETCVICHNPSATDKHNRDARDEAYLELDGKTQESFDLKVMLHAIHSSGSTGVNYVVQRRVGTTGGSGVYVFGSVEPTWPDNDATDGKNFIHIAYPNDLRNCEACHLPGTYGEADQSLAAAVTVDTGDDTIDQSDDVLMGPTAAACLGCHKSSDKAVNNGIKAHTDNQGINVFLQLFGYKSE